MKKFGSGLWLSTFHCYLMKNRVYVYIFSSRDRYVSFYQNSSVWLDRLDSGNWDRNPVDSNAIPRFYHSATRKLAQLKEI